MAQAYEVLAQSTPSATVLTDAYTVAAATEVIISSIVVCNRSNTGTSFRLAISPNGAADANTHYICYDMPIAGNDTYAFTGGLTLDATDKVRVYATLATLTFQIHGTKIT